MFLLIVINTYSQNNVELKLLLRDGNTISGKSKLASISLTTEYGKLTIPLKSVSSIDVGVNYDKPTYEKVANLLKQLANSNEAMRKAAHSELILTGIKAIPAIEEIMASDKFLISEFTDFTIEMALSDLKSEYNISGETNKKDVVNIDFEYTMGGIYEFDKIELKTDYGLLSIPKEKIKHIDIINNLDALKTEVTLKLMASKHISSNTNGGWLKTGIVLKQGQRFMIKASGEITMASLSGNKYKPDGSVVYSTGAATDAIYEGDYNTASTYPSYGNVVYKIGDTSLQILKAGEKFSGTATVSGMLFISIYETVYNVANTGTYTVKISLK